MKTEKNYQSAEVAQASTAQKASTTSTVKSASAQTTPQNNPQAHPTHANNNPYTISTATLSGIRHYGKVLVDIMEQDSAFGFLARLQECDLAYYDLLYRIDAGGGWRERQPNEDPATALEEIRLELGALSPQKVAERAYLLQSMGELLGAVEHLARLLKHDLFNK